MARTSCPSTPEKAQDSFSNDPEEFHLSGSWSRRASACSNWHSRNASLSQQSSGSCLQEARDVWQRSTALEVQEVQAVPQAVSRVLRWLRQALDLGGREAKDFYLLVCSRCAASSEPDVPQRPETPKRRPSRGRRGEQGKGKGKGKQKSKNEDTPATESWSRALAPHAAASPAGSAGSNRQLGKRQASKGHQKGRPAIRHSPPIRHPGTHQQSGR